MKIEESNAFYILLNKVNAQEKEIDRMKEEALERHALLAQCQEKLVKTEEQSVKEQKAVEAMDKLVESSNNPPDIFLFAESALSIISDYQQSKEEEK